MRRSLFAATLLGAAFFPVSQAVAQDDAIGIVNKAIVAHGGKDLLTKYPAAKIKAKGCMCYMQLPTMQFTALSSFQAPDKVRLVQTYTVTPPPTPRGVPANPFLASMMPVKTILQDGDKVRLFVGKEEVPSPTAEDIASARHAIYIQNIGRLVPLLDAPYKLSLADEIKVCERPCRGVKVAAEGRKDVTLYFDKGTSMLVKAEYKGMDPLGQSTLFEEIYMNYKDVRGIMYPVKTQILLRGQKHIDYEILEFLPLEKFDPSEFANP